MLASEYGWAKQEIEENVYLDELVFLVEKINKRKLAEYKMQLAITQNPHVKDPQELWKFLDSRDNEPIEEKLDKGGFEIFKRKLASGSKNIVVKEKQP